MERAATTASSLEAEQDSGNINRTQSMATLNEPSPQGTGSGSGPRCQDTILGDAEAQTRFETTSKQSNDLPLLRVNTLGSGEDRMKLKELMDLCTKLSDRVLDLETTKTSQAKEIASLKKKRKCYADEPLAVPLDGLHIDDKLHFVEESIEIMDREVKRLRPTVTMQEPSKTATRPTVPPPQHDPKDKGKAKMVEPEKPLKIKARIKFDEEVAQRLQA
ncbi:hypothetical protein Tco_0844155 [Tanacetum coccineum]